MARLLFWIGLLPWMLGLSLCGVDFIAGYPDDPKVTDVGVAGGMLMLMGWFWTPLCWVPAIVYRFLFKRSAAGS